MKQVIRSSGIPVAYVDTEHNVLDLWYVFKRMYGYPENHNENGLRSFFNKTEQDDLVGNCSEELFLDWLEKKYGPVERFYVVDLA